ncbi:MAG: hypothetical protein NT023_09585 [Armatimonadetes bacterium]|nr:hypothetical protein [Armatimonadota bacterium]
MLSGEEAVERVQGLKTKYERIGYLEKRFDEIEKALFTATGYVDAINILAELDSRRNAVETELAQIRQTRYEELWSILKVPAPLNVRWLSDVRDSADRALVEEGVRLFASLTNHPSLEGRSVRIVKSPPIGERSDYLYGHSLIRLGATADALTVAHELGHWLEDIDKSVLQKSLVFLRRRTVREPLERLRDLMENQSYGEAEMAWKDKFLSPYVGKDYRGRASEVVSMGVQYLCEFPEVFAQGDPEHFAFVYDVLRGR